MHANATNRQTLGLRPVRVTRSFKDFLARRRIHRRDGTRRTRANPTRLGGARARGLHAAIRVCLEFRLERALLLLLLPPLPLLLVSSRRTLAQFPHPPPSQIPTLPSPPFVFRSIERPIYSPRDFKSTRSKIREIARKIDRLTFPRNFSVISFVRRSRYSSIFAFIFSKKKGGR